jgi:hypothetical protein
MAPDRGLSDRKQPGVKGKKIRLTYAFTLNASEKLPPFVIGKAEWPQALNKRQVNNWGFITKSMDTSTKTGYRNWTKIFKKRDENFFFFRTPSLAILFLITFRTFELRILNQTLLHMSSPKIKAY